MRFVAEYKMKDRSSIPIDYHNGFVSLIKSAVRSGSEEVFHDLFDKRVVKPYTYAVRFSNKPKISDNMLSFEGPLKFFFSSASRELGTRIYNGIVSLDKFVLYNIELQKPRVFLLPEPIINNNTAIFQTLSPILIRHHQKNSWYALPEEEGFEESVQRAFEEEWRNLYSEVENCPKSKLLPLKVKKIVAKNYNASMFGFTGSIKVESSPEMLNLIQQAGFGQRRSQGFGMLEAITV